MTDYIKAYKGESRFMFEKEESDRLLESLSETSYVQDGVLRWESNDAVPPSDVREFYDWFFPGVIDLEKCESAEMEDISDFIGEYRKNQPAEATAEEKAEMRAAFGPGVEMVDVITGRRTVT